MLQDVRLSITAATFERYYDSPLTCSLTESFFTKPK